METSELSFRKKTWLYNPEVTIKSICQQNPETVNICSALLTQLAYCQANVATFYMQGNTSESELAQQLLS